ncbi:hypothetical protein HMPREF3223_01225 [Cutibacterium avidum]|nr:hypothetical protein HMPREF3223_01225 [Cutibacterium avidum]
MSSFSHARVPFSRVGATKDDEVTHVSSGLAGAGRDISPTFAADASRLSSSSRGFWYPASDTMPPTTDKTTV